MACSQGRYGMLARALWSVANISLYFYFILPVFIRSLRLKDAFIYESLEVVAGS